MIDPAIPTLSIPFRIPWRIWLATVLGAASWLLFLTQKSPATLWLVSISTGFALVSLRHFCRRRELRLTGQGVDIQPSGRSVPYPMIEAILPDPRRPGAPHSIPEKSDAVLIHSRGIIPLPGTTPGRALWLAELDSRRQPLDPARDLPPILRELYHSERATYGDDTVFSAKVLSHFPASRFAGGFVTDFSIALLLAGIPVAVAQAMLPPGQIPSYQGAATFTGIGALLLFFILLLKAGRRSAAKRLKSSGLVISPSGLALHYGALQGKLHWDELLKFRLLPSGRSRLIRMDVTGSSILLGDFFDKSLDDIHAAMSRYATPAAIL